MKSQADRETWERIFRPPFFDFKRHLLPILLIPVWQFDVLPKPQTWEVSYCYKMWNYFMEKKE